MQETILDRKQFESLMGELESIKKLLVLTLRNSEVKGEDIAKAIGVSEGRLSQIFPKKKYKKSNEGKKNK